MDILRRNIPIKQFKLSELEEIWLDIVFKTNAYPGNTEFDIRKDFLDKLEYPELNPFARITLTGVTSSKLMDIVVGSNVGFYKRIIDTLADTVFYLEGLMMEASVRDLACVWGVGPKTSRIYHHRVRPPDDPIVQNTVILDQPRIHLMRTVGFFVPNRFDAQTYRQYELTYLHLFRTKTT